MSIVPIHRRGANVAQGTTVPDRSEAAPPDRVPILMRMPDLARIDGPHLSLETHQPSRPAQSSRPQAARPMERSAPSTSAPSASMRPKSESAARVRSSDEADSPKSADRPPKVRATGSNRSESRRRREMASMSAQGVPAWFLPRNLLVGAAVLAVIISIVAMVRRPATQAIESPPPAWNPGGAVAPAVNPMPAAPVGPTATGQPPVPGESPVNKAVVEDVRRDQQGTWTTQSQENRSAAPSAPSPSSTLPLPEPEPGQWPTRSAMRVAPQTSPGYQPWGGYAPPATNGGPNMTAPQTTPPAAPTGGEPRMPSDGQRRAADFSAPATATLTGTIDKAEQPTLRAEHERIGQGVY
ncbi:MAG: hypothetical protein K8T91_16120 [Planctomycetes bacterium]|nr:hypothetical protein [Planctomycetota bacterium]